MTPPKSRWVTNPVGHFDELVDPFNQPTELTSHQKNTASVEFF